jgi:hypothetical protein
MLSWCETLTKVMFVPAGRSAPRNSTKERWRRHRYPVTSGSFSSLMPGFSTALRAHRRVHKRLQVVVCLSAWLIATGCQWDLVQLVAWGRMFAGYSQEMSMSAAARKTFSGEMCSLCRAVQKGKQEQEQNSAKSSMPGKSEIKLLDACPVTAMAGITGPVRRAIGIVAGPELMIGRARMAPPLPPPRVVT